MEAVLLIIAIFLLITLKEVFLINLYLFLPGYLFLVVFKNKMKISEKLIFSIPVSLLFVQWPYFIFTRAGLTLNSYFFYFPAVLILILVVYDFFLNDSKNLKTELKTFLKGLNKFTKNIKKNILFCSILIVCILIFYYIFSPFLLKDAVPLTLGSRYTYETELAREGISKGTFPIWSDKWYNGMHMFFSYPPLSYLFPASVGVFTGIETWKIFNLSTFLFTFLFWFALYCFLKYFKLRPELCLLISAIVTFLPISIKTNAAFKEVFEHFFIPLFLLSFIKLWNSKQKFLFVVTCSMWIMNYYFNFYVILIPISAWIIFNLIKKEKRKNVFHFLISIAVVFLLISSWALPFVYYLKYFPFEYQEGGWNRPMSSILEFLNKIASPLDPNKVEFKSETFTAMSPQFFYLGLISVLVLLVLGRKKIFKNEVVSMCLLFVFLLAFVLIELLPIHEIIPYRQIMYGRGYHFSLFLPFLGLGITALFSYILKDFKLILAFSIVILLVFLPVFLFSANDSSSFLSEEAVVTREAFAGVYDFLEKQTGEGRFFVFGIYGPGVIPAITYWTKKPAFAGYGFEAHVTKSVYKNLIFPISDASMDYLKQDIDPILAYNIFRIAGVDTLIFNICRNTGKEAYEHLMKYNATYTELVRGECILIFALENQPNIEKTFITKIIDLPENIKTIEDWIKSSEGGFLFTFLKEEIPLNEYSLILVNEGYKDVVDETQFKKVVFYLSLDELGEKLSNLSSSDGALDYQRQDNLIRLVSFYEGSVLLKESYFPLWASINIDKKIYETEEGLMALNVKNKDNIILRFKENEMSLISLIASLLGYIILLIFASKKVV